MRDIEKEKKIILKFLLEHEDEWFSLDRIQAKTNLNKVSIAVMMDWIRHLGLIELNPRYTETNDKYISYRLTDKGKEYIKE